MLKLSVDNWDIPLTMLYHSYLVLDLVNELGLYIWMMCHVLAMNLPCLAVVTTVYTTVFTMKMLELDVVVSLIYLHFKGYLYITMCSL